MGGQGRGSARRHGGARGLSRFLAVVLVAQAAVVSGALASSADADPLTPSATGPVPGACPNGDHYISPYPARHDGCLRTSQYAQISVTPAESAVDGEVTFTIAPILDECSTVVAQRTYPCIETMAWDTGQVSGLPYRMMNVNGTALVPIAGTNPPVLKYYQPLNFQNSTQTSCIGGRHRLALSPTCTKKIMWVQGVGNIPDLWTVVMPAIYVAEGPAANQIRTIYLDALLHVAPTAVNNHVPVARWDPVNFGPGDYLFDATDSSDPDGDQLTYNWDFGDGTTGSGVSARHVYDTPGQYDVNLIVRDPGGLSSELKRQVVVKAPELDARIDLLDANGDPVNEAKLKAGDVVTARLKVAATSDGVGALSSLIFNGDPLQLPASGALAIVSGPTPPVPDEFTLEPGESVTFDYQLEVLGFGRSNLSSWIIGADANDQLVEDRVDIPVSIGGALNVVVKATPNTLNIEYNPDGTGKPQEVAVTVEVTNQSTKPIEHVALEHFLNNRDNYLEIASTDALEQGNSLVWKSGPTPSANLGTIAAGATKSLSFKLTAQDNGEKKLTAYVRGDNPDATNPSTAPPVRANGSTIVTMGGVAKVLFQIDYLHGLNRILDTNDPDRTYFMVEGIVKNLSTTKAIDLDPLIPVLEGNAGGGNLHDIAEPLGVDGYPIPIGGRLDPTERKRFSGIVYAGQSLGTTGIAYFAPNGRILNGDGTETQIVESDVKFVTPAVEHGAAKFEVSIRDDVPPPEEQLFLEYAGEFLGGMAKGSAAWFQGSLEGAWWLVKTIGTSPIKLPVLLFQTMEFMVRYYYGMTDGERSVWFRRIAADVAAWKHQSIDQVLPAVNQQLTDYFTRFENAQATGDWRTAANMLGEITGQASLEIATWNMHLPSAKSIVKFAEENEHLTKLGRAISESMARLGANSAKLSRAVLRNSFGFTDTVIDNLTKLAREKGYMIAARLRSSEAVRWIEEFAAVLKPEAIKLKSVDEIDALFLGYRPADIGSVVLREPISRDRVLELLAEANATTAQRRAALRRWALRSEEWTTDADGYAKSLLRYKQRGKIPVPYNYADNVPLGTEVPTSFKQRFFQTEKINVAEAGEYQVIYMSDSRGAMQRVTGDVDLVAVTHADGTVLTPTERIQFYELCQKRGIECQHPETFTFNDADVRGKQLDKHSPGGEALAVFGPDGNVRPSFIDPNLSFYDQATGQGRIYYLNGAKSPIPAPVNPRAVQLATAPALLYRYVPPSEWPGNEEMPPLPDPRPGPQSLPLDAQADEGDGVVGHYGDCDVVFSTSQDAGVLRLADDASLEQWDPDGWVPFDASACNLQTSGPALTPSVATDVDETEPLQDGVISVLPQTSVARPAEAGATRLEIASLDALGLKQTPDEWFEVGDRVVIDPGGPHEEFATIAAFGSLVFAEPPTHPHGAGEAASPGAPDDDGTGGGQGNNGNGNNGNGSGGSGNGSDGGTLPTTGSSPVPFLFAVVLVGTGLVLVAGRPRRRRIGPHL